MPLIHTGDLDQLITILKISNQKFSDSHVKFLFIQILKAVSFMHDGLKIAHRDIKPQNIMIDQFDEILLADFGSSKRIHKESLETVGF